MQLPLTSEEAETLHSAGTVLQTIIDPVRTPEQYNNPTTPHEEFLKDTAHSLQPGIGLFQLLTDCAFLEPVQNGMARCAIFGQPQRPAVCSTFPEGGKTCQSVRLSRGVWDY